MHIRVAAHLPRDSDPESMGSATAPELNSCTLSKFSNKCWPKFRQLATFRQSNLSQIPKNHLFRIGPPTASHGIAQNFKWSSDAQDSEEI
jgi:hypothetical protein